MTANEFYHFLNEEDLLLINDALQRFYKVEGEHITFTVKTSEAETLRILWYFEKVNPKTGVLEIWTHSETEQTIRERYFQDATPGWTNDPYYADFS